MQVSRWGDSLAVRLPAAVVEALGLQEGDDIEIQVEGPREFTLTRTPDHRELLARLRRLRGRLPASFRFDRLEAHERGLAQSERYGFAVYDAMILAAAQQSGCDTLLTEDLQHGQRIEGGLTVWNPFLDAREPAGP